MPKAPQPPKSKKLPRMNRLSSEKRRQIIHLMVEGNTVNGIERLTGASKHTILRLLELAGTACMAHHDRAVRGVNPKRRHSTIGYMSPMDFEMKAGLA